VKEASPNYCFRPSIAIQATCWKRTVIPHKAAE
jgi:hypothetical protein